MITVEKISPYISIMSREYILQEIHDILASLSDLKTHVTNWENTRTGMRLYCISCYDFSDKTGLNWVHVEILENLDKLQGRANEN